MKVRKRAEDQLESPAAEQAGDGGGWAVNGTEAGSEPRSTERQLLAFTTTFELVPGKAQSSAARATAETTCCGCCYYYYFVVFFLFFNV